MAATTIRMIAKVRSQGHQPCVATSIWTSVVGVRPVTERPGSSSIYPGRREGKWASTPPRAVVLLDEVVDDLRLDDLN
jgi:hypothetical protein